jgi:hypothetical protein
MEEKQLLETAEIDENDWEQTPVVTIPRVMEKWG